MKCTTITLAIIVLLANFAQTAYVKAPTHIEANALLTVADPEPSCPYPSEDLTFYPDPSDCSKYFECYEGNKYSITCPSDMYWDTSNSMCAAKESVNCGDRGISTADPVTTTTTPITSTTETPEAPTTTTATTITPVTPTTSTTTSTAATTAITVPTSTTPDPLCPYPSDDITYFPDPYNCSQYYECYRGRKFLVSCPSDMYWSSHANLCEPQANVDCDDRSTITSTPITNTPTTSSPTVSSTTTTAATTTSSQRPTETTETTVTVTPTTWTPDPECPYPSDDLTYFPDPYNCSQYYECYRGRKFLVSCPSDMYWSSHANLCELQAYVDCDDRSTVTSAPITNTPTSTSAPTDPSTISSTTSTTAATTTSPETPTETTPTVTVTPTTWTPDPQCPYPSDDLTYFPDPYNCSQYYECYRGRKFLVSCPSDMYWSSHANLCELQANVDCDDRSTITSGPITNTPTSASTVTITTTTTASTITSSQTPTATTAPTVTATATTWTPDPQCPYPSDDLTYFPDPSNCSQYYECYRGRKFLVSCPSDMYWSSHANLCELQANVDCDDRSTVTSAPITNTPTPTSAPTDPLTVTSTTTTTAPTTNSPQTPTETTPTVTVTPTTWTPDPQCPYPSDDLTYFPDPSNCSRYYECYRGRKFLVSCPSDMYWSSHANLCELQANVDCDDRSSPTTTTASTTTSTETSTETIITTVTATPTTSTPDPQCPYPSDDLTYYPHPSNCSQYYECYRGKKYLESCPSDMYWDTQAEVCELREYVNCDDRSSTSHALKSLLTSTESPTDTTTPANEIICPYPSEDLIFYPNEDDCSQYWECYEGNKYLITCPSGLLWNIQTNMCDYEQNVNCTNNNSTTTKSPNTGPTENPDGRCIGQPDGSFHANLDDCSKFYECVESKPVDEQCPNNTLWNQAVLSCDYPSNVVCNN